MIGMCAGDINREMVRQGARLGLPKVLVSRACNGVSHPEASTDDLRLSPSFLCELMLAGVGRRLASREEDYFVAHVANGAQLAPGE
jgi:hypothetical protein